MISGFTKPETRFLSNFYPCTIILDELKYPSVEHAYVASKCKNLADKLMCTVDHYDAKNHYNETARIKKFGRTVDIIHQWDSIKYSHMLRLIRAKFTQNPHLAKMLVETSDHELIEENWWGGCFWGVCRGSGQNNLGKILMFVRDELDA